MKLWNIIMTLYEIMHVHVQCKYTYRISGIFRMLQIFGYTRVREIKTAKRN